MIGRALMVQARDLRGELEVEVFERNLGARAFYAEMGSELMHRTVHEPTGFELMRPRLMNHLATPTRDERSPGGDRS